MQSPNRFTRIYRKLCAGGDNPVSVKLLCLSGNFNIPLVVENEGILHAEIWYKRNYYIQCMWD